MSCFDLFKVEASNVSKKPPVGFALIRPLGHHAIAEGPLGFCIFDNVTVAARYAVLITKFKLMTLGVFG